MNPATALLAAAVGAGLVVAGVVWLVGPWGLVGSGVVLMSVGLLVPVRERRGEPADEPADAPPPTG